MACSKQLYLNKTPRKRHTPPEICETCAGLVFHIERLGHASMPMPGFQPGTHSVVNECLVHYITPVGTFFMRGV